MVQADWYGSLGELPSVGERRETEFWSTHSEFDGSH